MRRILLTEQDRLVYEDEIAPLLPERLFDAHCHLLANRFHPGLEEIMPLACDPMLNDVDVCFMETWWRALFPDAQTSGLLLGFPTKGGDWRGENEWLAESAREAGYPFSILTHPDAPRAQLEADIRRLEPTGLKPYMVFARRDDPNESSIADLIPEEQIALADGYGLTITLHVAKPRGMADPDNLRDIARLIRDYPRCHFILAHCGRCFITPNMEAALEHLPVAENLWMDTSAVCDVGVFVNLFAKYDRSRLLFGTDLVTATGFRGSYVRLGLSWHDCRPEMVTRPGGLEPKATYAAYENLAALCHGAKLCGLSEEELRGVFYDNAARLFRLEEGG